MANNKKLKDCGDSYSSCLPTGPSFPPPSSPLFSDTAHLLLWQMDVATVLSPDSYAHANKPWPLRLSGSLLGSF